MTDSNGSDNSPGIPTTARDARLGAVQSRDGRHLTVDGRNGAIRITFGTEVEFLTVVTDTLMGVAT